MRKFSSIGQFRHIVETVEHKSTYLGQSPEDTPIYDKTLPRPTLTFNGTVKLHGTNAGVAFDVASGRMAVQSRERILSLDDDNMGFCAWATSTRPLGTLQMISQIAQAVHKNQNPERAAGMTSIHVFGEWCGPSVNGKTAIGQLPERLVIFHVLVTHQDDSEVWLDVVDVARVFNMFCEIPDQFNFSTDFKQWTIEIDFSDPGKSLELLEQLTIEVERECPAAKALGLSGLGEGIVWEHTSERFGRLLFKTKGAKHKGTKNRQLVFIAPEVMASREAFAEAVLTESRLEQGLDLIVARHGKATLDHMGEFLMWIGRDVIKEEGDTLQASGLDRKEAMTLVNRRAKAWVIPRFSAF
jgi:hypothetical protein